MSAVKVVNQSGAADSSAKASGQCSGAVTATGTVTFKVTGLTESGYTYSSANNLVTTASVQ